MSAALDVAVLVPVLGRPWRVKPLVESLYAPADAFKLLFVCDPDDDDEHDAIRDAGEEWIDHAGTYAEKINTAYRATWEPFVFLGADDLRFHPSWFDNAVARMNARVGVVGTNDLGNPRVVRGLHATHSLVARWYADHRGTIDHHGQILSEAYRHNFCDTELVQTAKKRRAFAFAKDSIVEHLHPHWNAAVPDDATYRKGQESFAEDQQTFRRRSRRFR